MPLTIPWISAQDGQLQRPAHSPGSELPSQSSICWRTSSHESESCFRYARRLLAYRSHHVKNLSASPAILTSRQHGPVAALSLLIACAHSADNWRLWLLRITTGQGNPTRCTFYFSLNEYYGYSPRVSLHAEEHYCLNE